MKKISCIILLGLSLFFISSAGVYAALSWSEVQPAGDANGWWHTGAISADGTTILTGMEGGRLYLSSNSGGSFSETQPAGNATKDWYLSAISSNGQSLVAGVYYGRLYLSSNGGSNWSETQPDGNSNRAWYTGAISSNGQTILVGEDSGLSTNGRLFVSTNGGSSWTETQPAGNADKRWVSSSMSSDGTKMIVGTWQGYGRLFISTNSGGSWTETQPAGNVERNWFGVDMSADGQKIIAGVDGGRVYISTNGGSNWSETQPAGNTNQSWETVAISSDGQTMLAAIYGGRMYLSTNGGSSWAETQPAGNTTKPWYSINMSSDAQTIMANVYNGRVYIGSNPLPTATPTSTPAPTATPTPTPTPVAVTPTSVPSTSTVDPCPGFATCPNAGSSIATTQVITSDAPSGESGSVLVPSVPGSMALTVSVTNQNSAALLTGAVSVPVPWSQGFNTVGGIINFTASSSFNGYPVTTLAQPATIMLTYDPKKLAGRSPKDLRIGWYNPKAKKWQLLNTNTVVKPGENLIANTTVNTGYYTVLYATNNGFSSILGAKTKAVPSLKKKSNVKLPTKTKAAPKKQ